jgi:hypothetical protein
MFSIKSLEYVLCSAYSCAEICISVCNCDNIPEKTACALIVAAVKLVPQFIHYFKFWWVLMLCGIKTATRPKSLLDLTWMNLWYSETCWRVAQFMLHIGGSQLSKTVVMAAMCAVVSYLVSLKLHALVVCVTVHNGPWRINRHWCVIVNNAQLMTTWCVLFILIVMCCYGTIDDIVDCLTD